jgi:hypothetical protein
MTAKGILTPGARALLLLLSTVGFGAKPGTAEELPAGHDAQQPSHEDAGSGEHAEYRNTLAAFLGGTAETAEHESHFTIGLEYERELGRRWALMAVAEHVSDLDAWVLVAPVAFKPLRGLSLMTGPGLETAARRPAGHDGPEHEGAEAEENEPFFLWRFGAGYTVHLGERLAVTPNADLDLVRERGEWAAAWVFGVSLGVRF